MILLTGTPGVSGPGALRPGYPANVPLAGSPPAGHLVISPSGPLNVVVVITRA